MLGYIGIIGKILLNSVVTSQNSCLLTKGMSIYTNEKKKQCIAKMLITHKICSGWAWKFINMVSLIHTFNYQTCTRFHVRLLSHPFLLWKLHFMASDTEKQHATKLIDAKCKFMELMIRKPLYFLLINAYQWRHTFLNISFCGKNATCKRLIVYAGNIWCMWII